MPRERKPTDRLTYKEKGGTNPTPPPVDPTTKKKPKYEWEEVDPITGGSASFLTGGYLPVLAPTSPVAAGGAAVADAPDVVVITDDEDEDWDEDDTFRLQRPHPLILSHLYNDDEEEEEEEDEEEEEPKVKVSVSATGKGKHTVFDDE